MTELTAHQRATKKQYEKRKATHTQVYMTKELRDWLKTEAHAIDLTIEEYIKYLRVQYLTQKRSKK